MVGDTRVRIYSNKQKDPGLFVMVFVCYVTYYLCEKAIFPGIKASRSAGFKRYRVPGIRLNFMSVVDPVIPF